MFVYRDPTPDYSLGFRWLPATLDCFQHLNITPVPFMAPDNRAEVGHAVQELACNPSTCLVSGDETIIQYSRELFYTRLFYMWYHLSVVCHKCLIAEFSW